MTRPRAAAQRFVEDMPEGMRARIVPLYSPLLDIVPLTSPDAVGPDEVAIFTSSHGVLHGPEGAGRPAYCVGARTTEAARDHGWDAQQAGLDAASLVDTLSSRPTGQKMVHIRGQHTRGDVADRLRDTGQTVREVIVYDQVLRPLSPDALDALASDQPVIAPVFSPRTATQFANCAARATSLRVVALSPAVAEPIKSLGVCFMAERPEAQAMYDAIDRAIRSG